jgi:ABC-type sulfate/molybdate transport systems ATPase subunit
MNGLLLEGLPGLPRRLQLDLGEQRALVVPDAAAVRQLADLVAGLEETPPGAVVKTEGPVRLVPAEGGLLPHLTVVGNIVHGHTVTHQVTRRAAADESRLAAINCGLGDVLDRYPHEITPGRRRQTGVARALQAAPAVVVLEDAPGLPTWGSLLPYSYAALSRPVLLLITTDPARTTGFHYAE